MSDVKYKYLVALSDSTSAEDLEALLNEKASYGFELFMLHEVDSRMGKTQYNCIFYKMEDVLAPSEGENIEITDTKDFKHQIEKLYKNKDTYNQYVELQKKIAQTEQQISDIKKGLESEGNETGQSNLNESISEKINCLNDLKAELAKVSDSFQLYDRIKSDKITIYLSEELVELAENGGEDNIITRNIKLRQDITDKLGYVISNIRYSDSMELEPYQYRIDVREVPAASGQVYPGYRMFFKGQYNSKSLPKDHIKAEDPIYLFDVYWLKEEDTKSFWDQGLSASDVIARHLAYTSIKFAPDLLDYRDITKFVELVRKENPDLVDNLVPDVVSMGDLKYIVSNLIKEMVSVKDIGFIFEKIMDNYQFATEKEIMLEKVRVALRRQITYSRIDESNIVYSIVVDPALDKYLNDQMILPENTDSIIELTEEETEQLMSATVRFIENNKKRIENCVIVCSEDIRQALFALYEEFIPGITILANEELAPDVDIEEIGTLERKVLYKNRRKNKEDLT